ncbi:protein CutA homolog isoform X2 [Trichomycterus rosablanca]|uniref:protein CutA homolog isoform X2 n=1 Tax=Trichomycterus rosablanca TaxID=2290929 RepID=UPI002F356123
MYRLNLCIHKDLTLHCCARRRLLIFLTIILTLMLYPVILPLTLRAYSSLTGSYLAGHHSLMLINCPSERTAKDIGRYIMEKRMAARVNISPLIYTMFYWKEEIQDSSEVLLLVRTRTLHIQRLTDMVKTLHPYEIPEILVFPIDYGNPSYLRWMDEAVPEKLPNPGQSLLKA